MVCSRWRPRGRETVFITGARSASFSSTGLPMEAQKLSVRSRFVEDTNGKAAPKGSEIYPRPKTRRVEGARKRAGGMSKLRMRSSADAFCEEPASLARVVREPIQQTRRRR